MTIPLNPAPTSASAILKTEDVQTLISAISPLFTLTPPQSLNNCTGANLNVRPDGTGMIMLRFAATPAPAVSSGTQ